MRQEFIGMGNSIAEALDAALEEMGVQQDVVDYEVVEEDETAVKPGRTVKVRAWVRSGAAVVLEDEATEDDDVELSPAGDPIAEEITDEELDEIADTAVDAIGWILRALGIEADVDEYEGDEGEIILDIVGPDLGLLIGRHGRTLDALQVLVTSITNRRLERRYPVVVDIAGYRHRRRGKLEDMARRAADRVARQQWPVEMRPMSSYDRRIIHMALRDDRRVTTESEGLEPQRMVVVRPAQGRR